MPIGVRILRKRSARKRLYHRYTTQLGISNAPKMSPGAHVGPEFRHLDGFKRQNSACRMQGPHTLRATNKALYAARNPAQNGSSAAHMTHMAMPLLPRGGTAQSLARLARSSPKQPETARLTRCHLWPSLRVSMGGAPVATRRMMGSRPCVTVGQSAVVEIQARNTSSDQPWFGILAQL